MKYNPEYKYERPFKLELTVDEFKLVFNKAFKTGIYGTLSYDISVDGQQFLMIERNLEMAPNHLNVVLNWSEELKRKIPVAPE